MTLAIIYEILFKRPLLLFAIVYVSVCLAISVFWLIFNKGEWKWKK